MGIPDVVYAPAYPDPRVGHDGVCFETRTAPGGEIVGIAFRSMTALTEALGPAQPWIAIRLDLLGDVLGAAGIQRILVDPAAEHGWDAGRLEELTEVLEDNRG